MHSFSQLHYLTILLYSIRPLTAVEPLLTLHHQMMAPFKPSSPVFNVLDCHLKRVSPVLRKSSVNSCSIPHAPIFHHPHRCLSAKVPLLINSLTKHQAKRSRVSTQKQRWPNSATSSLEFFCLQMNSYAYLLLRRSLR